MATFGQGLRKSHRLDTQGTTKLQPIPNVQKRLLSVFNSETGLKETLLSNKKLEFCRMDHWNVQNDDPLP